MAEFANDWRRKDRLSYEFAATRVSVLTAAGAKGVKLEDEMLSLQEALPDYEDMTDEQRAEYIRRAKAARGGIPKRG